MWCSHASFCSSSSIKWLALFTLTVVTDCILLLSLTFLWEQVYGDCLLSGGDDGKVLAWRAGAGTPLGWACDRTLAAHRRLALCLTVWGGRAVSGSSDQTHRVWPAAAWAVAAATAGGPLAVGSVEEEAAGAAEEGEGVETLRGHWGAVYAVATAGHRLVSAAADGVVRVWEAAGPLGGCSGGSVPCVAVMKVCPAGSWHT